MYGSSLVQELQVKTRISFKIYLAKGYLEQNTMQIFSRQGYITKGYMKRNV